MPPQFKDLPQELVLRIVEILLQESKPEDRGQTVNQDRSDNEFQYDLDLHQVDFKLPDGEQAMINLSRTCSAFYNMLSSQIFRSITIRNSERSGKAVNYLCTTSQIMFVKTLHFKGEAPGDESEDFYNTDRIMPQQVQSILSDLSQLPSLETLIIDFTFHLETEGFLVKYWGNKFFELYNVEAIEETKGAEAEQAWRALMQKVFDAISEQKSTSLRNLVVKICPVRPSSAFYTERFKQWLEILQSFTFQVYACDFGAGWQTNTLVSFRDYISNLDHYFLDALRNVTRLTIIGHEEGPIALVPLRPEHCPRLKELELGYYFIQDDLIDFLGAHSETLERLTLNHCYVDGKGWGQMTWYSFFHGYAAQKPVALESVVLKPHNAPIPKESTDQELLDMMSRIKTLMVQSTANGIERRVFAHAEVDEKYGTLFESEQENLARALGGHDQRGWEELMTVVNQNRQRI